MKWSDTSGHRQEARRQATGSASACPRADDQINLTDEDSRIMKVAWGGFEQCYNAQAVVDSESLLVMASQVTQAANDKNRSNRW